MSGGGHWAGVDSGRGGLLVNGGHFQVSLLFLLVTGIYLASVSLGYV